MWQTIFSLVMVTQTIRISIPYILASIGGTFSERGGVINIGLEGMILNGAFCAVLATWYTGNAWAGVIAAVIGGALTALIHAVVSIRYKANQIISGVAINLFAVGITKFILKIVFHSSSNSERVAGLPLWKIPIIDRIPVINTIFSTPLILLTLGIIILSHILIFKTPFGLRLRSCGEHPQASDTLGVKVNLMRYSGVLISGALAGLGGGWLSLDQHCFTDGMSGGRGFIALAAMIFGKWTPLGATGAALLFGFAEALQIQLQSAGVKIPTQFVQMIPYLLTLVVLASAIGRAVPPAADGIPYEPSED